MRKSTYWKIRHGNLFYGIMLVLFALCFASCKDDEDQEGTFDPNKPIVITDFTPKKGGYGSNLILFGDNFGNDLSKVKVTIGGKNARVITVKNRSLYCVIPEKAYDGNVELSIVDENGEVLAGCEAEGVFEYEKKWLVSTFLGTRYEVSTDFEEKEGPFDDCGGFSDITWLSFDPKSNFDKLYFCAHTQKNRLIDFAANDGKGYVYDFITPDLERVFSIQWTSDENKDMVLTDDTSNNSNRSGAYLVSRSSNFTTFIGLFNYISTNGSMIHPINGEYYCTGYYASDVNRYDFETKQLTYAFQNPRSKAVVRMFPHPSGKFAYLMQYNNHYIARTDYDEEKKCFMAPYLICGQESSVGWIDGVGTKAKLNKPTQGVFVKNPAYAGEEDEYDFYFCDEANHCVRVMNPQGRIETFAGRGNNGTSGYANGDLRTEARFNNPRAIAYDEKRNCFYVGDAGNKVIRKIAKEE